jgi:hypothetical protein
MKFLLGVMECTRREYKIKKLDTNYIYLQTSKIYRYIKGTGRKVSAFKIRPFSGMKSNAPTKRKVMCPPTEESGLLV